MVYQKQQSIDAMAASSPASAAADGLGQAESTGGNMARKDSVDSLIIYNGWLHGVV